MDKLFTETPLRFLVQNLWRDEAFTYFLAKEHPLEIIQLTAGDFNPPLYYLLMHVWIKLFGASEIALRAPSVIFFGLTCFVIFLLLEKVWKFSAIKSGVLTLFFAMNPFLLFYASEARMYMMVTFWAVLSYSALMAKRKRLYVIATTLGLYTHYFMIFILAAQILQKIINNINVPTRKNAKSLISHFVTTIRYPLYSLLLFLPWALFMSSQHNFSEKNFWIILPPVKDLFYLPFILFTGYERVFGEYYHDGPGYTNFHWKLNLILISLILIPLISLLIHRFIKGKSFLDPFKHSILNTKHQLLTTLLLWSFLPPLMIFVLSYIYQPLFTPRYFIFSSAGFSLLLIYSLHIMWIEVATLIADFQKKRRNNALLIKQLMFPLFSLLILTVFLKYTFAFHELNLEYHSKRTVSNMYQEINFIIKPEDKIYLTSVLDYYLAKYYSSNQNIYIYDGSTYESTHRYVGKVLIPEDRFAQVLPPYPSRAFIIHWSWYEIDTLYR